jgi:hypothetical protein
MKKDTKDKLKDLGIIVGGSTLGAAAGYGLSRLARARFGDTIRRIDPNDRLKYISPALGALAVAGAAANTQRKSNEKRASYYLETII